MFSVQRALVVFVVVSILIPLVVFATVLGAFLFLPLPASLPDPKPPPQSRITHVYDALGNQIGVLHRFETSIPVKRSDIPRVLKQAVVAAEDKRFYSHRGVDLQAALRALWADIRGGGYIQGGSTITQQYVKDAYTGRERTILRKLREAILASQVNRKVPKDVVLYRYLSNIYLGGGAYGVGAAAESYFRKPVSRLTLSESALLAGIIHSPTRLDPRSNPGGAEEERMRVLDTMLAQRRISQADYDRASVERIFLIGVQGQPNRAATVVHPPVQQEFKYPYFMDYVRRYLIAKYGVDRVYRDGLRVETTLDPALQELADRTIANALNGTQDPLAMSLVAMEPPTGYVRAMVGGRDFNKSQVNLALGNCSYAPKPAPDALALCMDGGGTGRPTGSAFKPFTLAKAFEDGMPPTKVYSGPASYTFPRCSGIGCTIHNVEEEGGFGGLPLRQAMWHSVNTVFGQLIIDIGGRKWDKDHWVGVRQTAELAHRLGMTMLDPEGRDLRPGGPDQHPPKYAPQLTLGQYESSPLDMATAFGVFAARGMKAPVTPVLRVLDANRRVLEDNSRPQARRVLSEVVADNVTDVLRGVITSGTGKRADLGRPAAGKTGTGEEFRDAWFVGFTPTLSTAVWMGNTAGQISLLNVKGVPRVYGGTLPAQTWKDFMAEGLKDVPVTEFNEPAPIIPPPPPLPPPGATDLGPGGQRRPDPAGPPTTPFVYLPPSSEFPTVTTYEPYTVPTVPPTTSSPSTTTTTSRGFILFPP